MEVNESHSPVFNRPFVRITDGSEETGDYLFVDIEVRQAIALRDALLAKYPVEMLADPVPTAQDMYNEVMRRYDALPTQWGYALIYCWRQVASEWGLAGFQSPKEVSYAESYERLHLTKPLEFEGD